MSHFFYLVFDFCWTSLWFPLSASQVEAAERSGQGRQWAHRSGQAQPSFLQRGAIWPETLQSEQGWNDSHVFSSTLPAFTSWVFCCEDKCSWKFQFQIKLNLSLSFFPHSFQGMDSGFAGGEDETYNVYDQPFRSGRDMASNIYRPSKNIDKDAYADDLDSLMHNNRYEDFFFFFFSSDGVIWPVHLFNCSGKKMITKMFL